MPKDTLKGATKGDITKAVAVGFMGIFGGMIIFLFIGAKQDVSISGQLDVNSIWAVFIGLVISISTYLGFKTAESSASKGADIAMSRASGEWARQNDMLMIDNAIKTLEDDLKWTQDEIEAYEQWKEKFPEMTKWALPRLQRELERTKTQLAQKKLEKEEMIKGFGWNN